MGRKMHIWAVNGGEKKEFAVRKAGGIFSQRQSLGSEQDSALPDAEKDGRQRRLPGILENAAKVHL
jgi:hypothetical protein